MAVCELCPRRCGADRSVGRGVCGADDTLRVARAALHMWEEPCITGARGSGTVFFSGCPLRCVYCQNYEISRGIAGRAITVRRLADIFLELQSQGAHNINLVTPTHYVPQILAALELARAGGLSLPVVYNSGGYELPETLRSLRGFVDIYMPDFKYASPALAQAYSGAPDYPDVAKAALAEMVAQCGTARFDGDVMTRGVLVRHLVLPGCTRDSKAILKYLRETYGDSIYISIMRQFTPTPACRDYPELNRRLSRREYDAVVDYALSLGIENGFTQEGAAAKESFIPPFDLTGV